MNVKIYKILRFIIFLLLVYTILSGLSMFLFHGFIDFPCFAYYDKQNSCFTGGSRYEEYSNNSQINSFLTVYKAGWSGGGCNYKKSDTNTLKIKTEVTELNLEKLNSELKVNGKILEKGGEFRTINLFHPNPWVLSKLEFENLGLITICNSNSTNQKIVISGSYGSYISLIKGFLILLVLILLLIFVNYKLKKFRESRG